MQALAKVRNLGGTVRFNSIDLYWNVYFGTYCECKRSVDLLNMPTINLVSYGQFVEGICHLTCSFGPSTNS